MRLSHRLSSALFRPVDAASLAVFRVVFGVVMLVDIVRYWSNGWIESYFAEPKHFFSYPLFDFVKPLPGIFLDVHFGVLACAAICIALGLYTRIAAAVFAAGFWWWFLCDQTHYLNHYYLIALIATLLVFVPTERAFSLDARFRPRPEGPTAPAWAVGLLRFQIGVPYVFGGIAKLNSDWFAREPMRMWLRMRSDVPLFGPYVTEEWCVAAFVWGGLLLDLLIVPALLWRRTRPFAYLAAVVFHGTNEFIFAIGIFPWLMMAATTIYFEPDWPRRLLRRPALALASIPVTPPSVRPRILALLSIWVTFQCLVPLRHFLYPGNASWTEEGHLYAWHMKLRDKSGTGKFTGRETATGRTFEIDPRDYLTREQERQMVTHPDMIVQFARLVARGHERETGEKLEVRAEVWMSLNGRTRQLYLDPAVDLAAQRRTLGSWDWIQPLDNR